MLMKKRRKDLEATNVCNCGRRFVFEEDGFIVSLEDTI